MNKRQLLLDQLEGKIKTFVPTLKVVVPATGWIKAIRLGLGMSLKQLGNLLSMTKQSAMELERREKEGSITLKTLRETARALDMELVYGFVPKDGSLDALLDRKAHELAIRIVRMTSTSMKLEDQQNSKTRIEKAIKERANQLKREKPKLLWD